MGKTLLFYGSNSASARDKAKEMRGPAPDEVQVIQADAYNGERLEADEIEFTDDVDPGVRQRVEELFGKFDNRMRRTDVNASIGGFAPRTPASDRRNLRPDTRIDNPAETEEHLPEIKPAAEVSLGQAPGNREPGPLGTDSVTGQPVTDRNKIARGEGATG